jgi:hypothetical protein
MFAPAQPLRICSHSTPITPNDFVWRGARHDACSRLEGSIYFFVDHSVAFTPRSFAAPHKLHEAQTNHLIGFQRQHHQGMHHRALPELFTRNRKLDCPFPAASNMAWHASCLGLWWFDDPWVNSNRPTKASAALQKRNSAGSPPTMAGQDSAEICALSSSTSLLIAASEFPNFPTSLTKSLSETPNRFLTDLTWLGSAKSIFVRSGCRFLIFIISFFQF